MARIKPLPSHAYVDRKKLLGSSGENTAEFWLQHTTIKLCRDGAHTCGGVAICRDGALCVVLVGARAEASGGPGGDNNPVPVGAVAPVPHQDGQAVKGHPHGAKVFSRLPPRSNTQIRR